METVQTYFRITGDLGWPYYRPYLQVKTLLNRHEYDQARIFLSQWIDELRGRSRGQVLSPTALWALKSANLRALCLDMTADSPQERLAALEACDMFDLGRKDLLPNVIEKLSSPLNDYLKYSIESPSSESNALEVLNRTGESSPVYPILMYKTIRYCDNHDLIISRSKKFLKRFPQHYLADDVMGWMARSHLHLGRKSESIKSYLDILNIYPKGDMIGSSIFSIMDILRVNPELFPDIPEENKGILDLIRIISLPVGSEKNYVTLINTLERVDSLKGPAVDMLLPELLYRVYLSNYRLLKRGVKVDRAFRKEIIIRLVQEHPYHRHASYLAMVNDIELTPQQIGQLLKYCEDKNARRSLMKRSREMLGSTSQTTISSEEWTSILKDLPLGPDFFSLLSQKTHVASSKKDTASMEFLKKAYEVLPLMESIPMTDNEYRLYSLLFLRSCTDKSNLHLYPEVRKKTRLVSMNPIELKELELLDAIYSWRNEGNNSSLLKTIISNPDHPFKFSAGKILANDSRELKDWKLMLWSAISTDMSYVGEMALNLADKDSIEEMLQDPDPIFNKVRSRLLIRRTCMAIVDRDAPWLNHHRDDFQSILSDTKMDWLGKMAERILVIHHNMGEGTAAEKLEAEYQWACATYSPDHRVFDFYFDTYQRLDRLGPRLQKERPQLHTKALFTKATALVRTKDANPSRFYYYGWVTHRVGWSWLKDEQLRSFIFSPRLYLRAAEIYEECATLYPESPLADDSLYWAAHCRRTFLKNSWRMRKDEDFSAIKKTQKTKISSLINKIKEDYQNSDFFQKAVSFY